MVNFSIWLSRSSLSCLTLSLFVIRAEVKLWSGQCYSFWKDSHVEVVAHACSEIGQKKRDLTAIPKFLASNVQPDRKVQVSFRFNEIHQSDRTLELNICLRMVIRPGVPFEACYLPGRWNDEVEFPLPRANNAIACQVSCLVVGEAGGRESRTRCVGIAIQAPPTHNRHATALPPVSSRELVRARRGVSGESIRGYLIYHSMYKADSHQILWLINRSYFGLWCYYVMSTLF